MFRCLNRILAVLILTVPLPGKCQTHSGIFELLGVFVHKGKLTHLRMRAEGFGFFKYQF